MKSSAILLALSFVSVAAQAQVEQLLDEIALQASTNLNNVDILVRQLDDPAAPGLVRNDNGAVTLGDGTVLENAGPCAYMLCLAYKTESVTGNNGSQQRALRQLTREEVEVLAGLEIGSAAMKMYGVSLMAGQDMLNSAIRGQAASAGPLGPLFSALMDPAGTQGSNRFANPMTMFGLGGQFALAAGQSLDRAALSLATGAEAAQAEQDRNTAMMQNASLGPVEDVAGIAGQRINFSDINQTMQTSDGQDFVLNNASMWVDTEHSKLLRHRVEGTVKEGRKSRQFFIESVSSDFRTVPGTDLYEPYKTTARMGGIMDAKQQAELAKAREQLADFDARMAAMPPDQRAMVEGMIGGQIDMLRNMADDGVMEYEQVTEAIYVNPDLKALYRIAPPGTSGAMAAPATTGPSLVQRIQRDLQLLGYDPGNTDGELTLETTVAISQYQAEKALEVTGEPSEELAAMLAMETGQ